MCGSGAPFRGWYTDPTLAPVTDPSLSLSGRRALYAQVGRDVSHAAAGVVIAHSDDGGSSWADAEWVEKGIYSGASCGADMPFLASNPAAPYDTYAMWAADDGWWMRQIWYDIAQPPRLHGGAFVGMDPTPPAGSGLPTTALARTLAFGQLPPGCAGGGEVVMIMAAETFGGRCDSGTLSRYSPTTPTFTWWLSLYVPAQSRFYGPFAMVSTSIPYCLGDHNLITNMAKSGIAVEPGTTNFWFPFVTDTPYGNHVAVASGTLTCGSNGPTPTITTQTTPCVADPLNGQCYTSNPSGGPPYQDEWEPALAFSKVNGIPRVAMQFYGMRDDRNNHQASSYAWYSENYAPFGAIAPVAFGAGVPWPTDNNGMPPVVHPTWDYQQVGVNTINGDFLAAWAGDWRTGQGGQIMSDLLVIQ